MNPPSKNELTAPWAAIPYFRQAQEAFSKQPPTTYEEKLQQRQRNREILAQMERERMRNEQSS